MTQMCPSCPDRCSSGLGTLPWDSHSRQEVTIKTRILTKVGEAAGTPGPPHAAGGSAEPCGHCAKVRGSSEG